MALPTQKVADPWLNRLTAMWCKNAVFICLENCIAALLCCEFQCVQCVFVVPWEWKDWNLQRKSVVSWFSGQMKTVWLLSNAPLLRRIVAKMFFVPINIGCNYNWDLLSGLSIFADFNSFSIQNLGETAKHIKYFILVKIFLFKMIHNVREDLQRMKIYSNTIYFPFLFG